MKLFLPLYLKLSKKRFYRSFRPFATTKKPTHLISVPNCTRNFMKSLYFLSGLRDSGKLVILIPKTLEGVNSLLKQKIFETIFYEKTPMLFSKEYKILKERLGRCRFNFLIELNTPANISLPYLIPAEKRICLGDKNVFPYYNILIKDGINALNKYFDVKNNNPQDLFRFNTKSLKKFERKFRNKGPLLFVNTKDSPKWDGHKIIIGEDILPTDLKTYEILYLADAYYGEHDGFYEFAKIFDKKIIG
jgi:hypothetical protein